MAGTTKTIRRIWDKALGAEGLYSDPLRAFFDNIVLLVADIEVLRAASYRVFNYKVEDLAAGADITERGFYVAPFAETVLDSVKVIPEAASVGVDGSNTLVITLRNITEAVNIATVTRTTNLVANTPVALTLTAANADIAASDVLGVVVTQGATADAGTFVVQFATQRQTVDAAADMTAFSLAETNIA